MTTPTNKPVPSKEPADLLFNAEKLDEAVNGTGQTYLDRFGVPRMTLPGAMASIAAVVIRGAWVTATLYSPRDVVSNGGTWYIALDTHTSGATFAGDLAAHWRVYQGVLASDLSDTATPSKGDATLGVKTAVTGAQATTQHQINEERTSVFQFLTSTQIAAVASEAGASGAICSAALQAGLDGVRSGSMLGLNTFPVGTYVLDVPLRIKNGTSRISWRGDSRIRSILTPNAADIKQAPQNVNALIINQDNNPHFCMENMRMTGTNGYTGVGIYCVEGGGADASGQCIFSGVFRNLWIDFGTTNTGFMVGCTQNTVFDTMTFENMKGIFNLQGVGSGDNFYSNVTMLSCFDQFMLQTTDTNGSFAMTVRGMHVYNHLRGHVFDVQNWIGGVIDDVYFEAGAGNLGSTGVGRFKACNGTLLSNIYALARSGVPACAIGLEFDTFAGKVSQGVINGDIGIRLTGTGAMALEINNFDFTDCNAACLQIFGNITGTLITRGCKFNRAQGYGFVNQVASSCDWYSIGDEFLDAGLSGTASYRNIAIATSGKVVLTRPRIGRTTGSAAAQYWIEATGSGTVDIYDPVYVGVPPSGIVSPASTQAVNIHITPAAGIRTITAATATVLESDYDLIFNRAGTVTVTLPAASSWPGRELCGKTIQAQSVISASSNVVPLAGGAAGTALLAATAGKFFRLKSDGSNWNVMEAN